MDIWQNKLIKIQQKLTLKTRNSENSATLAINGNCMASFDEITSVLSFNKVKINYLLK